MILCTTLPNTEVHTPPSKQEGTHSQRALVEAAGTEGTEFGVF